MNLSGPQINPCGSLNGLRASAARMFLTTPRKIRFPTGCAKSGSARERARGVQVESCKRKRIWRLRELRCSLCVYVYVYVCLRVCLRVYVVGELAALL